MKRILRIVSTVLAGTAIVAVAVSMGLDWSTAEGTSEFGPFTFHLRAWSLDYRDKTHTWLHDGFDGDPGIGLLRSVGPLTVAALGLSIITPALVGASLYGRDRTSTWGGILGLVAGATTAAAVVVHTWGTHQFAAPDGDLVGSPSWAAGSYVASTAALLLFAAGILSLVPATRHHSPPVGMHYMKCPRCDTVNLLPRDVPPSCTACGAGAERQADVATED